MAKDSRAFPALVLAVVILVWLNWNKFAGAKSAGSRPGAPNSPAGSGCGCGCSGGPTAVNATTPINPTTGSSSSTTVLQTPYVSGGFNTPKRAPGSNASAPGSGGNWQGVRTRRATGLTPQSAPNAPVLPVGKGVWVANATPATVQGGAA
jgi:hypothetical protein